MNMKKIVINGGKKLSGSISVSGAKNSVVALIPAAILTDEIVEIYNVPKLSDTENLKNIINLLEGKIVFGNGTLTIDSSGLKNNVITEELSNKLRASYYFMGALLGRFKKAEVYYPGGCKIGKRPIDIHLKGFEKLGATINLEGDKYIITADELKGAPIYLDFPSVGATINILLAAVLAKGKTVIENAAKEPEIINIATLLNNMGANISGAGTDKITIVGVEKLHGAIVETIPDRIEAGTYIMISALCGENLQIKNIIPEHVDALLIKLNEMGIEYSMTSDSIVLNKPEELKPINVKTIVYPGFPTDLGSPICVLLTQGEGVSNFKETIYETRMGHVPELIKMGANVNYTNTEAIFYGKSELCGTEVSASDLRAGAALIIAGLIANGTTKISNIEHILRGYEDIVSKLSEVGADIKIIEE